MAIRIQIMRAEYHGDPIHLGKMPNKLLLVYTESLDFHRNITSKWTNQWVDLRENLQCLQETKDFPMKYGGFL